MPGRFSKITIADETRRASALARTSVPYLRLVRGNSIADLIRNYNEEY